MSKRIRHIWAKANQYVKIHRYKPKKPFTPPDIRLSAAEINTVAICLVILVLLSRLIGC